MSVTTLTPAALLSVTIDILTALGTPAADAERVAGSLVGANLAGHDSHGIVRLIEYASFVEQGVVDPSAAPEVVHSFGAVRIVDGRWCWGQIAATYAADEAAEAAEGHGIGAAALRHCNHIGRLGEYAERLAERGLVSMIWCNADPSVAAFGGRERILGTNPFAAGVPVEGSDPVILDFATAATAEGKLRVARASGDLVEPGAVIDRAGNPSTDPHDFYEGGALTAFGGHKGYGLSVVIELLGGALSGNHPSITGRYRAGNGAVVIAMDPASFAATDFALDIRETIDALRATAPVDPSRPVRVPGDIEAEVRSSRANELAVTTTIWEDVLALRERLRAQPAEFTDRWGSPGSHVAEGPSGV